MLLKIKRHFYDYSNFIYCAQCRSYLQHPRLSQQCLCLLQQRLRLPQPQHSKNKNPKQHIVYHFISFEILGNTPLLTLYEVFTHLVPQGRLTQCLRIGLNLFKNSGKPSGYSTAPVKFPSESCLMVTTTRNILGSVSQLPQAGMYSRMM